MILYYHGVFVCVCVVNKSINILSNCYIYITHTPQPIPDQEEQTDKKRSAKDQGSPAKRKKTTKNYDIDLPDAPVGGDIFYLW